VPIRLRLTVLFTAATLLLLGGLGVLFVRQLGAGLVSNLDGALRTRAGELIGQLGAGATNFQDPGQNPLILPGGMYGQILTTAAVVLESSDGLGKHSLLTPEQAARAASAPVIADRSVTLTPSVAGSDPSRMRILAVSSGHQGVVVAVAGSREVLDDALQSTRQQLLLLGVAALVLSSAGAWFLAGAALGPMERMRRQAAQLQAHDADGGLAVPGTRDEVARLAVTLNELLARQHAALQREQAFVADAGHELRTPLTVLKGELELASRPGRSRTELAQTIATVSQETERLVRLAEDLLDLSGNHFQQSRMQRFDLSNLVRTAVQAATAMGSVSSVSLSVSAPARLMVTGDPKRLRQAVDNLLTNAIRLSPPGGTVSVCTSASELDALVEVCDQGPGFPQQFLPVAFERFTRADHGRTRSGDDTRGGGSGLGLAIVKSIMTDHQGSARAENNSKPPGARLLLRWPGLEP